MIILHFHLLYSGPFLQRGISSRANSRTGYKKIGPFLERGINFRGIYFLERGANLEARAEHTHPKTHTQVPRRPGLWFYKIPTFGVKILLFKEMSRLLDTCADVYCFLGKFWRVSIALSS